MGGKKEKNREGLRAVGSTQDFPPPPPHAIVYNRSFLYIIIVYCVCKIEEVVIGRMNEKLWPWRDTYCTFI